MPFAQKRPAMGCLFILVGVFSVAVAQFAAADAFSVPPAMTARAVTSCSDVTLSGGSIDSRGVVASTPPDKGHLATNGNITLSGTATIHGDATAGPGKKIVTSGSARVTGTSSTSTASFDCKPIDLSTVKTAMQSSNDNARIPKTSQQKNPLTGTNHTDFVMTGSDTLSLPAGNYYFTSFSVSGSAVVTVTGPVHILVAGSVSMSGGSIGGGSSYALHLWVAGTGFALSGGSVKGFIYAPSAGMTLSGGTITGSLFANTVAISGTAHVTRILDDGLPRVTITSPADGAGMSDPQHVLVKGTAADDETDVSLSVNGHNVSVAADGTWQTTLDLSSAVSPATVTATATDGVGNTASGTIHVVTKAPAISLISPAPGTLVARRMVSLSGSAGTAASLTVNGVPATLSSGGWALNNFDLGNDGPHTLTIVGTNAAGGSTISPQLTSDTSGPIATILSPADGVTVAPPFTLSGSVSDAISGVAEVTCNGVAATISGGTYSCSVATLPADQSVRVIATDVAGNTSAVSAHYLTGSSDTQPPLITIDSPANGSFTNALSIQVSGTATDDHAVAGVNVNGTAATITGNRWTATIALASPDGVKAISATAIDTSNNSAVATVSITLDRIVPTITAQALPAPTVPGGWVRGPVRVAFSCSDNASGVLCQQPILVSSDGGGQVVSGTATDGAGNTATTSITLNIDSIAPHLTVDHVANPGPWGLIGTGTATVHGVATDLLSGVATLTCNGSPAVLGANGSFTCQVALQPETNRIEVVARDRAFNAQSYFETVYYDNAGPSLSLVVPNDETTVDTGTIDVTVTASDIADVATLAINGSPVTLTGNRAVLHMTLTEGANDIVAEATDTFGNRARKVLSVRRVSQTRVSITSPADFATLRTTSTAVSGTVDPSNAPVTVNGVAANVSNGTFSVPSVPLAQGRTVVTAAVADSAGAVITSSINVYRDAIPPRLMIEAPAEGEVLHSAAADVVGMVDDIVIGTINSGQVSVTVNGVPAYVSNRSFVAKDVSLAAGANTILVDAVDAGGNRITVQRHVTRDDTVAAKVAVAGGNGQEAAIGARLPQPLTAVLTDGNGAPVGGHTVTFRVTANNGSLSEGARNGRTLNVLTDAAGRASVTWTLGTRSGAGNNRVEASAAGFAGPARFQATARTGVVARIVVDSGNNQYGAVAQPLSRPLLVVAIDAGNNRVAGVPVTFTVTNGGGRIGSAASVQVATDSDGRAFVRPTLGPDAGNDNNVVEASIDGSPARAVFVASGRTPGPATDTTISGVVLDNSDTPIPGVTIRIGDTSLTARCDAQGHFSIVKAPPGYLKLFVDGSTATRPGTWPMLEYAMYAVSGVDNTVGMPIYLLPIDVTRGLFVDETHGGALTLPELPGFSLTVTPGSATFPGGSRTGTVSVTLVHADKMPMPPGFGQQPRFLVTVQPPGVHFDPPAAFAIPNVENLGPGEVTEMYSFDHDLGQFVSIGTGTVTDDGSVLRSDPGVGIIKGGWHCGGNPATTGDTSCVNVSIQQPKAAKVGDVIPVTATGTPVSGGKYFGWQIVDDPADPNDDPTIATFISAPECTGTPTCTAQLKATAGGIVTVQVSYSAPVAATSSGRRVALAADEVVTTTKKVPISALDIGSFIVANGPILILNDKLGITPAIPFGQFQWVKPTDPAKALEPQDPIALRRSTEQDPQNVYILARFDKSKLNKKLSNVTVRASGGGLTFKTEGLTIDPADNTAMKMKSAETLPTTTKFYDPLKLHWTYQVDDGPEFDAGTTVNPLYVVFKTPITTVFYTTLHLAVSKDGAGSEGETVQRAWSQFNSRTLKAKDGHVLYYYATGLNNFTCAVVDSGLSQASAVEKLLTDGSQNGQCSAFADLFMNVLGVNGVASDQYEVSTKNKDDFLVPNWFFKSPPSLPDDPDGYKWKFFIPAAYNDATGGDNLTFGDLLSQPGVGGQNTDTPSQKKFDKHFIVAPKPDGVFLTPMYYDPSYGVTYADEQAFQNTSVAGFVKVAGMTVKDPGDPTKTLPLFKAKPTGSELNIQIKPRVWGGN